MSRESLALCDGLFKREISFMSNLENPMSIAEFINSLSFEWKLNLGKFYLYNQFLLEIFDIPNGVLGLPYLNNWSTIQINIDGNCLSGELTKVKSEILHKFSQYVPVGTIKENRVIILTIKHHCK